MTERKTKSKRGKTGVNPLMSPAEMKAANERATDILATVGTDDVDKVTDLAPAGLETIGDELTDDHIAVMQAVIEDAYPEPEEETRRSVFQKLHASYKRSGLADTKAEERRFFNILKDEKFGEIVKVTGRGVIGTRIVKIADKLCDLAVEGDLTAIKWALEVFGIKKSKYDYYQEDANNRRPNVMVGEINFSGKTDKELKEIRDGLIDVTGSAEILS